MAPIVVILGMLGTGILAIRANVLRSWQRELPLAIAVIYIGAVVLSAVSGRSTIQYAFTLTGVCYALLGNAIRRLGAERPSAEANVVRPA